MYNPVFFAYAIVTANDATLFLQAAGRTKDVEAHLGGAVALQSYDAIFDAIASVAAANDKVPSFFFIINLRMLSESSFSRCCSRRRALWR